MEAGGLKLIRIVDNGCGMVRDDALLAFERHATSKLRTAIRVATTTPAKTANPMAPKIFPCSVFGRRTGRPLKRNRTPPR